MMDNFTPNRFVDELNEAGVPEEFHDWLSAHGVGALVVKLGIRFTEMSAERTVATMPVEGNTQVAGILHGGAHVVLAETLVRSPLPSTQAGGVAMRWVSRWAQPITGPLRAA